MVVPDLKHLFNYCAVPWYEKELQEKNLLLEDYVRQHNLNGIERLIYQNEVMEKSYREIVTGVHLAYWPYWLDFWLQDHERMSLQFRDKKELKNGYAGADNTEAWLELIKQNIESALLEKPEYLVWHVADCNRHEPYTYKLHYTDSEVVEAAADVFNEISGNIPEDVVVLFENLWWPGLRLRDNKVTELFFNRINRKQVGIILDTGHLLNTEDNLANENDAIDFICHTVKSFGELKNLIKGLHLSCSLSADYRRSFPKIVPKENNFSMLFEHMNKIDQHKPFTNRRVLEILELTDPEYVVHELAYDTFDDLDGVLNTQLKACNILR